jgi:hypothetical protein
MTYLFSFDFVSIVPVSFKTHYVSFIDYQEIKYYSCVYKNNRPNFKIGVSVLKMHFWSPSPSPLHYATECHSQVGSTTLYFGVPISNLDPETIYPDWSFCRFPQTLQTNSRIVP